MNSQLQTVFDNSDGITLLGGDGGGSGKSKGGISSNLATRQIQGVRGGKLNENQARKAINQASQRINRESYYPSAALANAASMGQAMIYNRSGSFGKRR